MTAFITVSSVKSFGIRKGVRTVFTTDGLNHPFDDVIVVDSVLRDVRRNTEVPIEVVTLEEDDKMKLFSEGELHALPAGTDLFRGWERGEAALVAIRHPDFDERVASWTSVKTWKDTSRYLRHLQHG